MTVKRRFRWLLPKTMDDSVVLMLFDGPEMLFDRLEIQYGTREVLPSIPYGFVNNLPRLFSSLDNQIADNKMTAKHY